MNSGPAMPRRERDPDAKFSEGFFQTMKENASYSANKERHEALKFHQKLVKLDNLIGRRAYIVSQIRLADEALKSGTAAAAAPFLPPRAAVPAAGSLGPPPPSNEFLGMPSGRIEFEVAELKKELSTVDKELESMATASDDDEKLALPAKFS